MSLGRGQTREQVNSTVLRAVWQQGGGFGLANDLVHTMINSWNPGEVWNRNKGWGIIHDTPISPRVYEDGDRIKTAIKRGL